MKHHAPVALLVAVVFRTALAQESIDSLLAAEPEGIPVLQTFRTTQVVHGHSVETTPRRTLNASISHQFGPLQNGPEGGFGLDMACIRLGVDYGATDWLNLGIARSNDVGKPAAAFAKTRLLRQKTSGMPLSATWLSVGYLETRSDAGLGYDLTMARRFSSMHQLIVARKFGDLLGLQVAPTLVHRNLVPSPDDDGIALGLGLAAQIRTTEHISLTAEATPLFAGVNPYQDPALGIGLDIETAGHIFQLRLSNSTWISEDRLYTRTWSAPSLGFNLDRTFTL